MRLARAVRLAGDSRSAYGGGYQIELLLTESEAPGHHFGDTPDHTSKGMNGRPGVYEWREEGFCNAR